jgi:hypothetical protein
LTQIYKSMEMKGLTLMGAGLKVNFNHWGNSPSVRLGLPTFNCWPLGMPTFNHWL